MNQSNVTIENWLEKLTIQLEKLSYNGIKQVLEKYKNGNEFECLVRGVLSQNKELFGVSCEQDEDKSPIFGYRLNFGQKFPDIDVWINRKKFGLELKSTQNKTWKNKGGSVFEGKSSQDYENIYVLFGTRKNASPYSVKYKQYWEVLERIEVTHSPRYLVNMDAKSDERIFESWYQYKDKRNTLKPDDKDSIYWIQTELMKNIQSRTWYLPEDKIKPMEWSELELSQQDRIKQEVLILFPSDLIASTKRDKYKRANDYIMSAHFTYSTSAKDTIYATGGSAYDFKTIHLFKKYAAGIQVLLEENSEEIKVRITDIWSKDFAEIISAEATPLENYKMILDHLGKKRLKSEIEKSGKSTLSEIIFDE